MKYCRTKNLCHSDFFTITLASTTDLNDCFTIVFTDELYRKLSSNALVPYSETAPAVNASNSTEQRLISASNDTLHARLKAHMLVESRQFKAHALINIHIDVNKNLPSVLNIDY